MNFLKHGHVVYQQLLPSTIPEEERENSTLTSDDNDEIGDWQSIAAATREIIIQVPDNIKTVEINVQEAKSLRRGNMETVLPDPRSVRDAHRVAACYLEGEIGEEMVKTRSAYLMSDGTSRAKVGRMGASLVYITGKVRALKMQIMGRDTRENWADTIIFKFQRLSEASGKTIKDMNLYVV